MRAPGWFAVAVIVGCASIELMALSDRRDGEPQNRDIRRYVLGEIYDQYRIEQQFLVKADGLSSVTVHPRPASPSPSGSVRFQLYELGANDARSLVHEQVAPVVSAAQMDEVTLRFSPQPSRYRTYALDVTVEGASDGQGIGLLAARGEGHRGTVLLINGHPSYGGLIFETEVGGATTNFGAIAAQLANGGVPAPAMALSLILALKYAALAFVLRACVARRVAAAPVGPPGPAQPASR